MPDPPPAEPAIRSDFRLEQELLAVSWNRERFLVPAGLMTESCSLAKAGGFESMRYANYPRKLRPDDESVWGYPELTGLPEVPSDSRHLLAR